MTLIKMNWNDLIGLKRLSLLVLKSIYEPKKMSNKDEDEMMRGIMCWQQNDFKSESQEIMLEKLAKILKKNAEGKLERRKELFSKKGISYKRFHRLNPHVW